MARLGRPLAVVQAADDEFGSPDEVRAVLERARPAATLRVVPGTSHLFPQRARDAAVAVAEAAREMLGSPASLG